MAVLGIILAGAAVVLWLGLVATAATLNDSDPAGNGLSYAYGVFIAMGLWVLLGGLMIMAALKWSIPVWTQVAALVLVPASCIAAIKALHLISGHPEMHWPLAVMLAPGLIIGFFFWAALPGFRSSMSETTAAGVTWGLVALLSIAPWPAGAARDREGAANRARIEAEWKVEEARLLEAKRQERLANFQKLTAASPLWDYMPFIVDSSELTQAARDSARKLKSRQSDAERMLADGHHFPLVEIANLDLEITPRFCGLSRAFLVKHAKDWRPTEEVPPEYSVRSQRIEQFLPAMKYLIAHGCNIEPGVTDLIETVRGYPGSPARDRFLAELGQLRGG
jgi:hypothetical protein